MIEKLTVHSVEHFPHYPDVEHEILPLCPHGPKMSARSVSLGNINIHVEDFYSRVRYQEIQQGDTAYYGLFLPQGDPIRFSGSAYSKPFLTCWHGVGRNEYDYIVEGGTKLYMLEMPTAVCQSRGWKFPFVSLMHVQEQRVHQYVDCIEACLDATRTSGAHELPIQEQLLLEQFETMAGDPLFFGTKISEPGLADSAQRKIVSDVEAFLRTQTDSLNLTGDDLSRAMMLPRRTIYAAFKNQLGIGPSQFHRLIRLYQLRHLLRNTPYEKGVVSRLMLEVGFNHFGRTSSVYRNYFGEMPVETILRNSRHQL